MDWRSNVSDIVDDIIGVNSKGSWFGTGVRHVGKNRSTAALLEYDNDAQKIDSKLSLWSV